MLINPLSTKASTILVQIDSYSDYIPVVSTVTNLVHLFHKTITMNCVNTFKVHYFRHLKYKDALQCVILLIPIVGNIYVYYLRRINLRKAWRFEDEAKRFNQTNSAHAISLLKKAADLGSIYAILKLGLNKSLARKERINYLVQAVDLDNLAGIWLLSLDALELDKKELAHSLLLYGDQISENNNLSKNKYDIVFTLLHYYTEVEPNEKKAFETLFRLASFENIGNFGFSPQNEYIHMIKLAECHEQGKLGQNIDLQKALQFYQCIPNAQEHVKRVQSKIQAEKDYEELYI